MSAPIYLIQQRYRGEVFITETSVTKPETLEGVVKLFLNMDIDEPVAVLLIDPIAGICRDVSAEVVDQLCEYRTFYDWEGRDFPESCTDFIDAHNRDHVSSRRHAA